jgi:ATP-dependent DNA helicase RecG
VKLNSPVASIPKIGPKYKTLLETKLGLNTVQDLLYHFPFRYDDFSNIKPIRELLPNEDATVKGLIGQVQNIFTRNGKRITKAKLVDHTGDMQIIWFNQHYIKSLIKENKQYTVSGRVGEFDKKLTLIAPEIEESKEDSLNTGRLVPIYPETTGVSSKWLRSRINDVLSAEESDGLEIHEFLPEKLINEENLYLINKALHQIHFPDSKTEADIARRRFEFEELFLELLRVEKRKQEWSKTLKGIVMEYKQAEIAAFIENLPFVLTDSQQTSFDQIVGDMSNQHPMNRLLEGDVGTGKTVVAVLAAYLVQLNGFKTLYMAPTEILAEQHFLTFNKLLEGTSTVVELITGSRKPAKDWNILIGTHALLFNKESYGDIGLVIIDEQHRFGVEQRGKIMNMGSEGKIPHLLSMTATPIPRTLALTIYGDLSISTLKTHPNLERKITTKVVSDKNRATAYEWIKNRNEPTFIVCPFIETSDSQDLANVKAAQQEYILLSNGVFKGVPMGLLHGRMKPKEKQEIVEKFRIGEIKVLVSTPVIEVGIDIPDATIIVIESAERYGLASLHQLRGRVGRGSKEGFCFVMMTSFSKTSFTRLKYLEEINNGLELAEIDMKLRGEGDIFGTMQHGEKRLKVANLSNLELLEKAKEAAQKYHPHLVEYPLLEAKLEEMGKFVANN